VNIYDNAGTMKVNYRMQYYDVINKSKMADSS